MSDERRQILSDNLKYYLKRLDLTPTEFCRIKSIPYTTFVGWYNGKNYPYSDKLQMLADALEIKKTDLTERLVDPNSGYTFDREDFFIAQDISENPKLKEIYTILTKKDDKELDALLTILNPSAN